MPGRSGGPRQGAPGTAYSNRSDLNAGPRSAPAGTPSTPQAAGGGGGSTAPTPAPPSPGAPVALNSPSQRPGEHVMTGVGTQPGAPTNPTLETLQAILLQHPNPDLRDLVEALQAGDHGPLGPMGSLT